MTIKYVGIRPSYEVRPSQNRKLFPTMRPAYNNGSKIILQMEVIDIDHVEVNVNKSNWKVYHEFFTNETE